MNNALDVFGYEILDCIGEGTFGIGSFQDSWHPRSFI